jgi:hypothetical protein
VGLDNVGHRMVSCEFFCGHMYSVLIFEDSLGLLRLVSFLSYSEFPQAFTIPPRNPVRCRHRCCFNSIAALAHIEHPDNFFKAVHDVW